MNTQTRLEIPTLTASILLFLSVFSASRVAGFSQTAPMKIYNLILAQSGDPPAPKPLYLKLLDDSSLS